MARGAKGRTPLELLSMASQGDRQAGKLWSEYALVFKGRHQLQWSRGLRSILGLGAELSDKELADRADEDSILLASLSHDQWRVIKSNDLRGEVLEVASSGDAVKFWNYLESIGVKGHEGLNDLT